MSLLATTKVHHKMQYNLEHSRWSRWDLNSCCLSLAAPLDRNALSKSGRKKFLMMR